VPCDLYFNNDSFNNFAIDMIFRIYILTLRQCDIIFRRIDRKIILKETERLKRQRCFKKRKNYLILRNKSQYKCLQCYDFTFQRSSLLLCNPYVSWCEHFYIWKLLYIYSISLKITNLQYQTYTISMLTHNVKLRFYWYYTYILSYLFTYALITFHNIIQIYRFSTNVSYNLC